jgi:hypothetical protein
MTWLIALADTTHIVVGTVEILYLVFNGTLHWMTFSGRSPFRRWPEYLRRNVYLRAVKPCPNP